jgi:RNA polymerase sigma-32 factor
LFFNLRKIKQQILDVSRDYMGQTELNDVSKMLNIKPIEIQNMESRLTGGDVHLNQSIGDEDGQDLMSLLPDNSPNPQETTEIFYDTKEKNNWLNNAIDTVTDREKIIIQARKLKDKSITLDELGQKLKISKERVRQIETKALSKLKKSILEISQQQKEFFV